MKSQQAGKDAETGDAEGDHLQRGIIEHRGGGNPGGRDEQRDPGMPTPLSDTIRPQAPEDHADGADDIRDPALPPGAGAALRRLRQLEDENRRLKTMVAEQALDIQALKAVASKNW